MPTISYFYGIAIVMYQRGKEHNPPHIHAVTPVSAAAVLIRTGELIEGSLSPKAEGMVKEFVLSHRDELLEMWETGCVKSLPPLE